MTSGTTSSRGDTSSHARAQLPGRRRERHPITGSPRDHQAGSRIARYSIEGVLGRGGMGCVYRAFDEETNRHVAVKVARHIGAELVDHFLLEGEAQGKIRHPHIMPVYDRGWTPGCGPPYFVMELLYEPVELTEIVALSRKRALGTHYPRLRQWENLRSIIADVLVPIARGIDTANRTYGFLHRDLKPSNILIDVRTRRPYVIDFGNCCSLNALGEEDGIVGTPRFLSPEQARQQRHARTDVWGLGAILHYMICGEPPIRASSRHTRRAIENRIEVLRQEQEAAEEGGDAAAASEAASSRERLASVRAVEDLLRDARQGAYSPVPDQTPHRLRAVLDKAMAKSPGDRYANAGLFADDLEAWCSGRAVLAAREGNLIRSALDTVLCGIRERRRFVGAVLLALVLGAIGGHAAFSRSPAAPDLRLDDVRLAVARLSSELEALAQERGAVVALGTQEIRRLRTLLGQRLDRLEDQEGHAAVLRAWRSLDNKLKPRTLRISGTNPDGLRVVDLLRGPEEGTRYDGNGMTVYPGVYAIVADGPPSVRLLINVEPGNQDDLVMEIPPFPGGIPEDMIWIAPRRGTKGRGMLVTGYVTCEQYAEWLDDLPADQRSDRMPPRGFGRTDLNDSTRILALPDHSGDPVRGARPRHMIEYASWRSNVLGVGLRLATEPEWRLLAEGPRVGELSFAQMPGRTIRPRFARWSHGMEGLAKGLGEVVRAHTRATREFVVKGASEGRGWLALPSAIARSIPLAADEMHDSAFRVVMSVD